MATPDAPSDARSALLRQLPSVDELLRRPRLAELAQQVNRALVVETARSVLDEIRSAVRQGVEPPPAELAPERLEEQVVVAVERALAYSLHPVINATGVILHTNLGRAPLSPQEIGRAHV